MTTVAKPAADEPQTVAQFADFKAGQNRAPDTYCENSVVKPMILSHGTLGVIDLAESKRFYTEFLGLDCVRHTERGLNIRKGGYWSVVCLEIGEKAESTRVYNHWGLDVASREEVDAAYAKALELQEEYGIRRVNKIRLQHGDYAFKLQDRDGNWWEIQHIEDPMKYDKRFARGDVIPT